MLILWNYLPLSMIYHDMSTNKFRFRLNNFVYLKISFQRHESPFGWRCKDHISFLRKKGIEWLVLHASFKNLDRQLFIWSWYNNSSSTHYNRGWERESDRTWSYEALDRIWCVQTVIRLLLMMCWIRYFIWRGGICLAGSRKTLKNFTVI